MVRECLTWEAKAQVTTRVLNWVVGRGPRPELLPPKMLHPEHASAHLEQSSVTNHPNAWAPPGVMKSTARTPVTAENGAPARGE